MVLESELHIANTGACIGRCSTMVRLLLCGWGGLVGRTVVAVRCLRCVVWCVCRDWLGIFVGVLSVYLCVYSLII